MENKLKVEYVDIDTIKPYKNNAKLHPKEQIEQIKKSIENFGMNDPIGIWNNEIVEGHGRILACKELGYKQIPVIKLDHLTDEERKSYIIAHNKLTMNSDFDFNILDAELGDILNIDMSDFGFENLDINVDDYGTDFSLPDGEKREMCTMSFSLHEKQKELIEFAISQVKDEIKETFGNNNKNGNALYEVIRQWAEQKK